MSSSALRHLGCVTSESGPLLLLDIEALPRWGGTVTGDYERVCKQLDRFGNLPGLQAEIGTSKGLVWELGGAGSADVFRETTNRVVLSRIWRDEDDDSLDTFAASLPPEGSTPFGSVEVQSGWLVAFWPTERGSAIELGSHRIDGQPLEVAGVADGGILVTMPPGIYVGWHDDVQTARFRARRCWLVPEGEPIGGLAESTDR